ncbi:MAG TPA: dihydroorotate dehydrogenase [Candidatus Hydrogenedens sp.]|nr:dihydroorotate dehydrogenase [Candidatus Hydrogenedens sp.]HOK08287.1 dihydroorotate dehydrogenase [Candidatus Hydrogenedens sp.]HOL18919.1 dihydroorotate dehydrogenase [Candidatus Hydrogenedens sp.]HPP57581.1 dihydroorotate dehydrogenase [Candidatus Hydrogenedens sp.]
MNVNMKVTIGNLTLKNPVTVASGTFGYGEEYSEYFDISCLGAVTVKSLTLKPRLGNPPPRIVETPAGMLNAIGLQNVGLEVYLKEKLPYLRQKKCTIIANIYGTSIQEYEELAERLEKEGGADAIEMNLSCPNVHDARSRYKCPLVAQSPEWVEKYTMAVRSKIKLPLIVKLSPNVTDITEPAISAEKGGADAISIINTLLGMSIDIKTQKPKLKNVVGGLSGPAIRPVAVKMVWDVSRTVKIPVIGMGGICTVNDALEFIFAGAKLIAVGSFIFRDPLAPIKIIQGLEEYCNSHRIEDINKLIGSVIIS